MNLDLLKDLKQAYSKLNPGLVRDEANRNLTIGVIAESDSTFQYIRRFLQPVGGTVVHLANGPASSNVDVLISEPGMPCPSHAFVFHPKDSGRTICDVLDANTELETPLARNFLAFREPAILRIVHRTSKENAFFSVVTGLPNMVPNFLELPWAVGEFASDTAFITINQFRMAFMVAACNDRPIGYNEQKIELATIVAGAFGWRAIARELVGKIPLGGGLIPKAAIAYAGTYVVGRSLDRLHRTGTPMGRGERRSAYEAALERGKDVVHNIVSSVKKRNAA